MEKKESNNLIAEFMGLEVNENGWYPVKMPGISQYSVKIKYDTSFDWLMPVVEKIESDRELIIVINREATIVKHYLGDECLWKRTFWNQETKINHVYKAVVDTIGYLNKLKSL